VFPAWVLEPCGLPRGLFTVETLEFFGQVNFLKGGLVSADAVTTVSPTYAAEILTPAFGCGLEGVLAARRGSLVGILNGIDPDAWNPATDRHLPRRYGPGSVTSGKRAARGALADLVGVGGGGRPLVGMVSRLAEQKGADLLADVVDRLIELGLDIVVLGTGERRYEELLRGAQAAHPGRVHLEARFDEHLAHLIYAASDLFLMPSRYEPCGLGQMIAMRYGTVPIVHRTGGLVDSVTDIGDADGTGVLLDELSSTALIAAVSRALNLVADAGALLAVRRRGMGRDFSWAASAGRYLDLYRRLVAAG
jgi:starch synthase